MNINTKEIETLQKQKNDLLKQVDPLIAKKKKLYSDVDITTPKSSDEKKLDKEIADLFSEINDLVHKIVKLKKSQNEGKHTMKLKSVNEAIAVGKMVKVVDNPYWEAALGKKGPFKRKVKMIDGDNVFFTDGSNSSMKYVKEDTQLTNEADLNWNAVQNAIINFLKVNTKILDKRVQSKDTEGVKNGLKSILSGLTNAQRSLKLESTSRTAMEIGGLTGLNKDVVQKFVDTHKLDIEKVFQFVKKGKLSDRMDFVTAVSGKPNNPIQKKLIKKLQESVNEDIKAFDERSFGKNGIIIMIDDNGKKVSAIFKNRKNADKYNRNNPEDLKTLVSLANKKGFGKAIDESVNEAYDVETLPHLKKVSNEYYVDTPFIQYSNKFGNLVHAGFGDFLLKTSDGEVYFARTSKQLPGFVGRTHTMSGDATAIKKLIASMSSKYELNENVKKSTYNRVARILNNGKLDIY